jgi:cation transport ATPase
MMRCRKGANSTIKSKTHRLAQALQQLDEMLLDSVEFLVETGSLDVVSLVCLGSCSKAYRSAAAPLLEKRAMLLLPLTVKQAAASAQRRNKSKQKSTRAAVWVLESAACGFFDLSSVSAPATAEQYLGISNMPPEVAAAFLQAGLRFSYEQLMQAVRARTAGVEVWVTAAAEVCPSWANATLPSWVLKLCNNIVVS